MSKTNVKLMEEEAATNQSQRLNESKLLHDKVAVIFGAGGAVGSQFAREFSKKGATFFSE
jgi:hypothetical protein